MSGVVVPEDGPERYEDREVLGQGGLGRVVATHDVRLDRVVARKELTRDSIAHRERFLREARITAGLEHPSLAPIYDVGALPDGTPYYTMKRVDGRTLSEALARVSGLEERLALVDAVLRACEAVAFAHDRGIVHRDLKPDNLLLGRFGETWVVDWGLARRFDDASPEDPITDEAGGHSGSGSRSLTRVGAVVGTPGWMSPEQASAAPVTPAADVWSLGAVLYEVLTGRPPIDAPTAREAIERVTQGPVPPVALAAGGVPPDLAAVVDKALAFRAEDRYPHAGALADELRDWLAGRRVRAYAYSPWQVIRQELWRLRLPLAVGAAVLVVVALAAVEADRRERAGNVRALAAERREREVAARALAESLVAQGQQALEDRDVQLAGALGAAAAGWADLPEARGLVARALVAGAPARLGHVGVGWSCRWLVATADGGTVACGGDGVAVWSGDTLAWSAPTGGPIALSADGDRLVVAEAAAGRVAVRRLTDGALLQELPTSADRVAAVAWAAGRPVWAEGGEVVAADRRTAICRSQVTELRGRADDLHALCVNGNWSTLDPETLAVRGPRTYAPSVSFAFLPDDGGAWVGNGQSITWRSDLVSRAASSRSGTTRRGSRARRTSAGCSRRPCSAGRPGSNRARAGPGSGCPSRSEVPGSRSCRTGRSGRELPPARRAGRPRRPPPPTSRRASRASAGCPTGTSWWSAPGASSRGSIRPAARTGRWSTTTAGAPASRWGRGPCCGTPSDRTGSGCRRWGSTG